MVGTTAQVVVLFLLISYSTANAEGIGFAFSGAGGRIAQHAALMEVLVKGLTPDKIPRRPNYIAGASFQYHKLYSSFIGVSSGALSAIALNAILQTEDQHLEDGFTWDDYRQLVFQLKTSDVYDNSYTGIAKILTYNIFEGYFLDNTPLRNFLAPWFKKMNYTTLGDLYIPTSLTVVNQSSGLDHRLWSTDPKYKNIPLLDIVMASTALPMAFSPRKIEGLGDTIWIDGGTGIDTLPVYPLLANPNVTEVYAICYGGALESGGAQLPSYLANIKLLANGVATINDMRVDLFAGAFDMAARSTKMSWSWMPSLNQTFSALDFDNEKLEYTLAYDWAVKNNPLPLVDDERFQRLRKNIL